MRFSQFLLLESKQEIISLGFPPIIASLLYENFPKVAVLFAKWYRDYVNYARGGESEWWRTAYHSLQRSPSLPDLTSLYEAGRLGDDEFKKAMIEFGMMDEDDTDDSYSLGEMRESILDEIKEKFLRGSFFSAHTIIKDVASGKLKDLSPYKNLRFQDALQKYDTKRIFQDKQPIKTYPNGYRWIDCGSKNSVVANLMKNCGSTGCMSWDKDSTMLVLFDPNGKAHAIVTYSPNEKRISGDQGVGSSELKQDYHDYVLDLAKTLGVQFDAEKSKSPAMKIKYMLGDKVKDVQELSKTPYFRYFLITTSDGNRYYTDGTSIASDKDLAKVTPAYLKVGGENPMAAVFYPANQESLAKFGIHLAPIQRLAT